jgi:uncharacterized membrane protein
MDRSQELQHLAWAEEHLRQAHERIARQRALVSELEAKGLAKEAERARSLLGTLLHSLELMKQHHDQIEQELEKVR